MNKKMFLSLTPRLGGGHSFNLTLRDFVKGVIYSKFLSQSESGVTAL